jgi:sulfur carrier protein
MEITINGQQQNFHGTFNLESVITNILPCSDHVIAELNGSIIRREAWSSTLVNEGDQIELASFVGGG